MFSYNSVPLLLTLLTAVPNKPSVDVTDAILAEHPYYGSLVKVRNLLNCIMESETLIRNAFTMFDGEIY